MPPPGTKAPAQPSAVSPRPWSQKTVTAGAAPFCIFSEPKSVMPSLPSVTPRLPSGCALA